METVLMNPSVQPRHAVLRDGNALTLINSIRLDDAGLAQLGRVAHVVKIGSLHGRRPMYRSRLDPD
jgi:hypothetical protein